MNVWVTTEKLDISALSGRLLADCPRCGYTGFVTGEVLPEGTLEDAAQRWDKYDETATIPRDCPWIDPPAWWDKGLTAWGELLTEQWEIAKAQPKTARQRQIEQWAASMLRQAEQGKVDMVIDLLMSNKQP
jgi:hypothetical protein